MYVCLCEFEYQIQTHAQDFKSIPNNLYKRAHNANVAY